MCREGTMNGVCFMCPTAQVYGKGKAADCRKHVQKLNMMRGERDHIDVHTLLSTSNHPPEDYASTFTPLNEAGSRGEETVRATVCVHTHTHTHTHTHSQITQWWWLVNRVSGPHSLTYKTQMRQVPARVLIWSLMVRSLSGGQ